MQPEIYGLYDEIVTQRKTLGALRSAMANVTNMDEAERFSERIKGINEAIAKDTKELGKLLDEADEIEAESVRYETPDEFLGAFASGTESE